MMTLAPGSVIGILGAGQLGRMLALAAAPLGYKVHIYAPEQHPCAGDVAWRVTQGAFDDASMLAAFAEQVDVITMEFENVFVLPLAAIDTVPIFPPLQAFEIGQDRVAEKEFAERLGARTAPWAAVSGRDTLHAAIAQIGLPAILKTQRFGYDGKGQVRINTLIDIDTAWATLGEQPAILEQVVPFEHEFSVIMVRSQDGLCGFYDSSENTHKNGILATSKVPACALIQSQVSTARMLTKHIADALNFVGVITVEFFASADGPVFNEIAPRVHNSGHWTIEGAVCSQFENHIRAICGLPLGNTTLTGSSVEMTNLLGKDIDAWHAFMSESDVHLHLYDKGAPSPGRKMGHVTCIVR